MRTSKLNPVLFSVSPDQSFLSLVIVHPTTHHQPFISHSPHNTRCLTRWEEKNHSHLAPPAVDIHVDSFHINIDPLNNVIARASRLLQQVAPASPDLSLNVAGSLPGMYCIGANRHLLGSRYIHIVTATNKSSICIMVIWDNGRCSYCFAGDAEKDLEHRIAE